MIRTQTRSLAWILCFMACGAAAAQSPPATPASLPGRYIESLKLHQARQYAEAAAILEPFYTAGPNGMDWHWNAAMYQLARDEALAGNKDKAMDALMAAQARGGSVSADQLAAEADLASLHGDPRFKPLVEAARSQERLWARQPGQDLPFAPDLSEDAKIAGLSSLWAEARFNFAFFDRQPELDWNQAYLDFLPKVRAAASTEQYYRVLMRFAALLKDGHTNVYPPEPLRDAFYGRPGLRTQWVENAVVVTGIDDPALSAQHWRVGDVLVKIDGEDIRSYAEREIAPYQSSSTAQDLRVRTYDYALLGGRAGSQVHVTARNAEGKEENRVLTRLTLAEQSKLRTGGVSFKLRPDGIAVLTIDEFDDTEGTKALLANLSVVNASKGLVIDVRANGGGSTPVDLLQLLTREPIRGPLIRTRSYAAADRARGVLPGWSDVVPFEVPADAEHHVDVPVAVLTSARTFSAAEDFVAMFGAMRRGITVGETTAGSTGQPLFFSLPGGGSARVCTRNDRGPDGVVFEGVGLRPTIGVSQTVESVRRGRDVVLERAVGALVGGK
ncbi:S41 family peptidase [Dyella sp. SG609]|uniref:S41 family peptidase n=2 Tax=unclassified Dyella TaxID=2634549 RepID=UPI0014477EFD|nr:S41 family peptidase [Dyella sp. SG609]NKJ20064.1 C-terminal processing protease CtpA/Prc [Dyella sp. SG609]